jgi:hypothetical protein
VSEPLVTIEHIRRARELHGGFCTTGIRTWCARYNIDFRRLLQDGYPISEIEVIGDAFSAQVLTIARGEKA